MHRTQALLSGETGPVEERLLRDVRTLEDWGAAAIAIPCNTSHAFVPWLQARVEVPIIHMVEETAAALRALGARRVGVLGTDGTLRMGLYHAACKARGMEVVSPPEEEQRLVMSLIYDDIKAGGRGDEGKFAKIDAALKALGCDHGVLACTELSVYKDWHPLGEFYVDAMDVLARRSVEACGYPLKKG